MLDEGWCRLASDKYRSGGFEFRRGHASCDLRAVQERITTMHPALGGQDDIDVALKDTCTGGGRLVNTWLNGDLELAPVITQRAGNRAFIRPIYAKIANRRKLFARASVLIDRRECAR